MEYSLSFYPAKLDLCDMCQRPSDNDPHSLASIIYVPDRYRP